MNKVRELLQTSARYDFLPCFVAGALISEVFTCVVENVLKTQRTLDFLTETSSGESNPRFELPPHWFPDWTVGPSFVISYLKLLQWLSLRSAH
jgi:hypothetical protein